MMVRMCLDARGEATEVVNIEEFGSLIWFVCVTSLQVRCPQ